MNKFATCSHKGAIAYLFDRTGENLILKRCFLHSFQSTTFTPEAQNADVVSLEAADGTVKTTLKQLGKRFSSFLHGVGFVSEHWELLEHKATTCASRPVRTLSWYSQKKAALFSFLVVC